MTGVGAELVKHLAGRVGDEGVRRPLARWASVMLAQAQWHNKTAAPKPTPRPLTPAPGRLCGPSSGRRRTPRRSHCEHEVTGSRVMGEMYAAWSVGGNCGCEVGPSYIAAPSPSQGSTRRTPSTPLCVLSPRSSTDACLSRPLDRPRRVTFGPSPHGGWDLIGSPYSRPMAGNDAGVPVTCPACGETVLQKTMIPILGQGGQGIAYLCPPCARRSSTPHRRTWPGPGRTPSSQGHEPATRR